MTFAALGSCFRRNDWYGGGISLGTPGLVGVGGDLGRWGLV